MTSDLNRHYVLLLLRLQPPVCEVWKNDERVLFQPCKSNPSNLGSRCLALHFNITLPPQFFLLSFLDSLFLSFSHCLPIHSHSSSNNFSFTCYLPPLLLQSAAHLGVACTLYLSACAACTCTMHQLPESAAVSCARVIPLLPPLACTQVTVSPWGVCPSLFPLHLCVPSSPSLSSPLDIGIVRFLVSVSGGFLRKRERPRRLYSLAVACPGPFPPDTWQYWRRSGYPNRGPHYMLST